MEGLKIIAVCAILFLFVGLFSKEGALPSLKFAGISFVILSVIYLVWYLVVTSAFVFLVYFPASGFLVLIGIWIYSCLFRKNTKKKQ